MKMILTFGTLMTLMAAGCSDSASNAKTDPPVIEVQEQDADMSAAIAQAQSTLTSFIAALSAPTTNQQYFLIKGKFAFGDLVEHIWVADLTFDGQVFRGVLANDPQSIPGLAFKQLVAVPSSQVSDWMYVQDGRLVGGYTSRVLRRRMTADERREQDERNP